MMKITSFVTTNNADNNYSYVFIFDNDGLKSQVVIIEPYIHTISKWNCMKYAIEHEESYILDFVENHSGSIVCNSEEVIFNTMSSGTSTSVTISLRKYRDQILKCLGMLLNNRAVSEYIYHMNQ